MILGVYPLGHKRLEQSVLFTVPATFTDAAKTDTASRTVGPWVHFYELETTAGEFIRVCDFVDKDGGATVGAITFNGSEFTVGKITRSPINQDGNGQLPTINVSVADPFGTHFTWAKARDFLRGATARAWLIPYSAVSNPDAAQKFTLRVKRAFASEGPRSFNMTLGAPGQFDTPTPRVMTNRHRCPNEYHRRFNVFDPTQQCNAYSDDFEFASRQDIYGEDVLPSTLLFGWNFDGIGGAALDDEANIGRLSRDTAPRHSSETGLPRNERVLYIEYSSQFDQWKDASEGDVYLYKSFGPNGEDTDVDVQTKLACTQKDQLAGILIYDASTTGDWIFWGKTAYLSGGDFYRLRETTGSVSVDTDISIADHAEADDSFRVKRVGTAWTFYSRREGLSNPTASDTPAWTQRQTTTHTMSSTNIKVGLAVSREDTSIGKMITEFYHFRVLAGGLPTCPRGFTDCETRGNTYQFNGLIGMPDGTASFI